MNLVAKEYCACRPDGGGVLVLSEFAGASRELAAGALLVNPFDARAFKTTLSLALGLETAEERRRMRALRSRIEHATVYHWAADMLEDGIEASREQRRAA